MIKELAEKYNKKYGFPDLFIESVINIESAGNPLAHRLESRGRYSMGLMQVLRGGGAVDDWERLNGYKIDAWYYLPENNIKVGAWYLGKKIPQMIERHGQDDTLRNRIIAYNAGIGNLIKGIVPTTTQSYLDKMEKLTGLDLGARNIGGSVLLLAGLGLLGYLLLGK